MITDDNAEAELKKRFLDAVQEGMTLAEAKAACLHVWRVFKIEWDYGLSSTEEAERYLQAAEEVERRIAAVVDEC